MSDLISKLSALKPQFTPYDATSWGVKFLVKGLSAKDKLRISALQKGEEAVNPDLMARQMLVACVYDPDTSQPAFTLDDIDVLLNLDDPDTHIDKLIAMIMDISKISKGAVEKAKASFLETGNTATSSS